MNAETKSARYTVSSLHLLSVLYVSAVDISLMGFQREAVEGAGHDAWVAVIAAGIGIHAVLWLMYSTASRLPHADATLAAINVRCFGRPLGSALNGLFVLFALLGAFLTFRSYIEICKIWMFPSMNFWPFSLLLLVLVYNAVSGGFQTVAGICLWGLLSVMLFIAPFTFLLLPMLHPQNLLPPFDHSLPQYWDSTKVMAAQYLGVEVLLVAYPFIQHPAQSRRWAHAGVLLATGMFMLMLLVVYMYFSEGQLLETVWPTLNAMSVLEIPLMQRLEYLILSIWLLKIAANISLGLWAACHTAKVAFRAQPRVMLVLSLLLLAAMQWFVKDMNDLNAFRSVYHRAGLGLLFGFVPLLFLLARLRIRTPRPENEAGA